MNGYIFITSVPSWTCTIVTLGVTLLVLFAGGSEVAAGRLTPGDLMSFLISAQMVQRSEVN